MPRVTSDAAVYIGTRVADERRRMGMTQDELAAASGIDSSNIRAYEKGRAMPSIHTLLRIAVALGLEPSMLLDGLTLERFVKIKTSHDEERPGE